MVSCTRPVEPTLLDLLLLGIVLNDGISRMIERHQQRHITRDDFRQHAHDGADLCRSALVCQ